MTEPAEETTAPGVLVAVCRERADGERRVALTPDEVKRLGESGARVRLERGAGIAAGYPDESYALNGAELVADAAAALAGRRRRVARRASLRRRDRRAARRTRS